MGIYLHLVHWGQDGEVYCSSLKRMLPLLGPDIPWMPLSACL